MSESNKYRPDLLRESLVPNIPDWKPTANQEFLNVFRSAREAMFLIDGENLIHFWNKGAELLFGLTSDEVLGREIGLVIQGGVPLSETLNVDSISASSNGDNGNRIIEAHGLKKNGSLIPLELSMGGERAEGGLVLVYARPAIVGDLPTVTLKKFRKSKGLLRSTWSIGFALKV